MPTAIASARRGAPLDPVTGPVLSFVNQTRVGANASKTRGLTGVLQLKSRLLIRANTRSRHRILNDTNVAARARENAEMCNTT